MIAGMRFTWLVFAARRLDADAVVFLAGAGYVTGVTLVVDGGRLLKSGGRLSPYN